MRSCDSAFSVALSSRNRPHRQVMYALLIRLSHPARIEELGCREMHRDVGFLDKWLLPSRSAQKLMSTSSALT